MRALVDELRKNPNPEKREAAVVHEKCMNAALVYGMKLEHDLHVKVLFHFHAEFRKSFCFK